MSVGRLEMIKNKKTALLKNNMRDVALMLNDNPPKEEKASIRAEALIRDDNLIEALEILQLQCELLYERIKLLELTKDCPNDLLTVVGTIMWSTKRIDQIPEMNLIYTQLVSKYGKTFEKNVLNNTNQLYVNERVATKLSFQPPASYLIQVYLEKICELYDVEWKPSTNYSMIQQQQLGNNMEHSNNMTGIIQPMQPPQGYSVPYSAGTGLGPKVMTSMESMKTSIMALSTQPNSHSSDTSKDRDGGNDPSTTNQNNKNRGSTNSGGGSNNTRSGNTGSSNGGGGMMSLFRKNRNTNGIMASTGISSNSLNPSELSTTTDKKEVTSTHDKDGPLQYDAHDSDYQEIDTTRPNHQVTTNDTVHCSQLTLNQQIQQPSAPPGSIRNMYIQNDDSERMLGNFPTNKYTNSMYGSEYNNNNNNDGHDDDNRDDSNSAGHNNNMNKNYNMNPTWVNQDRHLSPLPPPTTATLTNISDSTKTLQTNNNMSTTNDRDTYMQSMEYADLASRFEQLTR